MPEKIAFALEPLSEKFGRVPLIKVLSDHGCFSSLLEAKQFVLDLADVAPQVVWVCGEDRGSFEAKLGDLDCPSDTSGHGHRATAPNFAYSLCELVLSGCQHRYNSRGIVSDSAQDDTAGVVADVQSTE